MVIVKKIDACTGCLICELACSFHHTRKYSRRHSSIKVKKLIFATEGKAEITLSHGKDCWDPVCDLCKGENGPSCILNCPEDVLRLEG
jgi:Fe-S-cluster-containing hydrogenase component 2